LFDVISVTALQRDNQNMLQRDNQKLS